MTNVRMRLVTVLSGLALAASLGFVQSSPAQAEPDIDDVQARVDQLFHEAEQASERYHDAVIDLAQLKKDLGSLTSDEKRADADLEAVRDQAKESILRQYTGSTLGAVGQVLTSEDPGAFLQQMSTMSSYQQLQQGLFDDYSTGLKALSIRRDATEKRLDQVTEIEEQLKKEQATIEAKFADAEELLGDLKEEERAEILSRGGLRVPSDVPTSGRAAAAIGYGMAQVGDAYVWAAAGPDAFDCSGFTMMAWAQAGVVLPHSSSMQYNTGTRIAASDLQPGDLVFYYTPISHVSMYIGNGLIVDAANPGAGVRVADLYSMPYVGAVRPG